MLENNAFYILFQTKTIKESIFRDIHSHCIMTRMNMVKITHFESVAEVPHFALAPLIAFLVIGLSHLPVELPLLALALQIFRVVSLSLYNTT